MWILMVSGCFLIPNGKRSDGADVDRDDSGDAFYGVTGDFAAFEPGTISVDGSDSPLGVSLTTSTGQTACSLGSDLYAPPVGAAQQIVMTVRNLEYQDCPDGLYPLDACDHDNQDVLGGDTCARYREWDETGREVVSRNATAGSIRIIDEGPNCAFQLELQFPTGVFTESWSMPTDDPLPWCAP